MTHDLRRLRRHAILERIPKTHRYRLTPFGRRIAIRTPDRGLKNSTLFRRVPSVEDP